MEHIRFLFQVKMDFRVLEGILDLRQEPAIRGKGRNNKQFIFDNWRRITFIYVVSLEPSNHPSSRKETHDLVQLSDLLKVTD